MFTEYRPSSIPSSCLTMAPRCDTVSIMNQTALAQGSAPLQQARVGAVARNDFVKPAAPSAAGGHILRGDLMKENESGRVVSAAKPMVPRDGTMPSKIGKPSKLFFPEITIQKFTFESFIADEAPQVISTEFLKTLQGQLQVLLNANPKVPFGRDSPFFGKIKTALRLILPCTTLRIFFTSRRCRRSVFGANALDWSLGRLF